MADSKINSSHHNRRRMNELYAIGDTVVFQCGNTIKEGVILVVDALGAFECQGFPSYDILVESENMLYKHVEQNFIVNSESDGKDSNKLLEK